MVDRYNILKSKEPLSMRRLVVSPVFEPGFIHAVPENASAKADLTETCRPKLGKIPANRALPATVAP